MSRQYVSAAKAVEAVDCGRQSFKSYCGKAGKIGKVDFALAAETMKFASVLEDIFKRAGISSTSLDVGSGMLKVMSYELLFGKKKISGGGAVKRAIMDVKDKMVVALESVMSKVSQLLLPADEPRITSAPERLVMVTVASIDSWSM